MQKLLRFHHDYLGTVFHKPKSLGPISRLHLPSKTHQPNSDVDVAVLSEAEELPPCTSHQTPHPFRVPLEPVSRSGPKERTGGSTRVRVSHPWPEWVDLMELLLKKGYFEDAENPFRGGELGTKETSCIRTACLNFARERFGLIRFLSRKDIQAIAGCGCPGVDRKLVNSGKRLRAHVGINEGNVCSSCNLRGSCDRAYVKAREGEVGRTVDVIRFLLTYGLDVICEKSENKIQHNKMVQESVRRLLKEMVEYSDQQLYSDDQSGTSKRVHRSSSTEVKGCMDVPMKQGDWICPKCNFLNFARNIRCLRCDGLFQERLKQLQEDQEHLPLKKGDWICEKCNFLNFAKNTRCLLCKEKPPKRHLNPGEWECESCNYINFRKNMKCLKCDYKRPKALNASKTTMRLDHRNEGHAIGSRPRYLHDGEANDPEYLEPDRTNQNGGSDFWRFEEEENADQHLRNKDSRYTDFPIVGGHSSLSQNARKREIWKVEMLERRKNASKPKEEDEEFRQLITQRRLKGLECSDDEDLAEWFGYEKKVETESSEFASALECS